MAISWGRIQALVGALLVLLMVGTGAVPAAAGPPGPAGSGGRSPSGWQGGGGHRGDVSAQQVTGDPAPSAGPNEAGAPRRPRQGSTASRKAPRHAGSPSASQPPGAPAPEPAKRRPESEGSDGRRDGQEDGGPRLRTAPVPVQRPTTAVRSPRVSTVSTAGRTVAPPDRPTPVRATIRPVADVVASSAEPAVTLLASPRVMPVQAAAVERDPRQLWPRLPGPAGHPAFPVLLAAVLIGFVVLGLRGDRRDPKLVAAAIDDRGERAEFR